MINKLKNYDREISETYTYKLIDSVLNVLIPICILLFATVLSKGLI